MPGAGGKGEGPKIFSFTSKKELGPEEDKRPTDDIAAEIIQKYGPSPEVSAAADEAVKGLDRYDTLDSIEPFLRGRSTIGQTPETYLALAKKWQLLRKTNKSDETKE